MYPWTLLFLLYYFPNIVTPFIIFLWDFQFLIISLIVLFSIECHCYTELKNEVILHFPYFTLTSFLPSSFAHLVLYIWSAPFCPIKSILWPLLSKHGFTLISFRQFSFTKATPIYSLYLLTSRNSCINYTWYYNVLGKFL